VRWSLVSVAHVESDFMFQLTPAEWRALMLQSATSNRGRGGRRKFPFVFTEHGAVMLASVLNTPIAVQASKPTHRFCLDT
jgi:hypothetical protein